MDIADRCPHFTNEKCEQRIRFLRPKNHTHTELSSVIAREQRVSLTHSVTRLIFFIQSIDYSVALIHELSLLRITLLFVICILINGVIT